MDWIHPWFGLDWIWSYFLLRKLDWIGSEVLLMIQTESVLGGYESDVGN